MELDPANPDLRLKYNLRPHGPDEDIPRSFEVVSCAVAGFGIGQGVKSIKNCRRCVGDGRPQRCLLSLERFVLGRYRHQLPRGLLSDVVAKPNEPDHQPYRRSDRPRQVGKIRIQPTTPPAQRTIPAR